MPSKKKKSSISKDLTDLMGEGVKIQENPKSKEKKNKVFFITLMDVLIDLDERTTGLLDYGIDLINYEDPYHQVIEGLINIHYGNVAGEIISWWLTEKQNSNTKNMTVKINEDEEVSINTPLQLYQAVKKINKVLED